MVKPKQSLGLVKELLAEKSTILSQAQTLMAMGMEQIALPLWVAAAALEERIAPLLDAGGADLEAAVHRISAASCYEKAGEWSRAVNLISRGVGRAFAKGYAQRGGGHAGCVPGTSEGFPAISWPEKGRVRVLGTAGER